jgi:hypothetical protein
MPWHEFRGWFGEDELGPCPECLDRAALRVTPKRLLCLTCGYIEFEDGKTTVHGLQGRPEYSREGSTHR